MNGQGEPEGHADNVCVHRKRQLVSLFGKERVSKAHNNLRCDKYNIVCEDTLSVYK